MVSYCARHSAHRAKATVLMRMRDNCLDTLFKCAGTWHSKCPVPQQQREMLLSCSKWGEKGQHYTFPFANRPTSSHKFFRLRGTDFSTQNFFPLEQERNCQNQLLSRLHCSALLPFYSSVLLHYRPRNHPSRRRTPGQMPLSLRFLLIRNRRRCGSVPRRSSPPFSNLKPR